MGQILKEIQSIINQLQRDASRAEALGDTAMAAVLRSRIVGAITVREAVGRFADNTESRLAAIVRKFGKPVDSDVDEGWMLEIPLKECAGITGSVYPSDSNGMVRYIYYAGKKDDRPTCPSCGERINDEMGHMCP